LIVSIDPQLEFCVSKTLLMFLEYIMELTYKEITKKINKLQLELDKLKEQLRIVVDIEDTKFYAEQRRKYYATK
jgi:hypothetical protein